MDVSDISTLDGSIQGVIDGVNKTFTYQIPIGRGILYRNGLEMTQGIDCVIGQRSFTFISNQIPQPGDVLTLRYFSLLL